MDVAGLARTLDEYLGQSVESIDGKIAGLWIFRPLPSAEGRISVSAAQDPGRTIQGQLYGQAGRRMEMTLFVEDGNFHDGEVATVGSDDPTVGFRP